MRTIARACAAGILLLAVSRPEAAKGDFKAKNALYPENGFPEITEAERSLADVPFAPGSPAVVLFAAAQYQWDDTDRIRVNFYRRVKILNADGVREHADYEYYLRGDWRVRKIEARTVLPDGTVVDAAGGTFRETSKETRLEEVRVAFPQAAPGAILDLHLSAFVDSLNVPPWTIQERLPVLRSEFLIQPPTSLKFRKVVFGMGEKKDNERKWGVPGKQVTAWSWENVAPLPDVPNRPSDADLAGQLVLSVDAVGSASFNLQIATDWKSFLGSSADGVKEWLRRGHDKADALARGLEPTAPRAAAEAVRRKIREQVRLEFPARWPLRESADAVLAEGSGTSMDLALLAVAMLREKGIAAAPAVFRRRSSGSIPAEFPVPPLLEDTLVRFMDGTEAVFFDPAADLPIGRLPWDVYGVLAAVFDAKSAAPVQLADFTAADQRVERVTEAELVADGAVVGSTTITLHAVAADRWREMLRQTDTAGQSSEVGDRLRRFLPGVTIESLRIDALDDAISPLVVAVQWRSEGYATPAGKRTLVNPFFFSRIEASDWPPGERTVPVDLRGAYEETDTVTLKIATPGGRVALPGPVRLNAGSVGLYEAAFEGKSGVVTARRHMRLNTYVFPASAYARLREWFVEIATADTAAVTLTAP